MKYRERALYQSANGNILRKSVAREVSIVSSLASERKKTGRQLFEWLRRNGECFKVKGFCNSYAVK